MGMFSGKLHLVLLAGGKGLRAGGGDVPKQFRQTGQGPLFSLSLQAFLKEPGLVESISSLTLTVPEAWRDFVKESLASTSFQLAEAGETRTQSTWSALQQLALLNPGPSDLVAVHDTARPFASGALLLRLAVAATQNGGAVPGLPVTDTIVQTDGTYLDRTQLVAVQTPQVFRWGILYQAHAWAASQGADFTDDGGLMAARGHAPEVIEGDMSNFKVTTESDWQRVQDHLQSAE